MLVRLESEESTTDLLANILVERVRAVFPDQLMEYVFVLINLELGREDVETDDMVSDSDIELLSIFLAVDNLR